MPHAYTSGVSEQGTSGRSNTALFSRHFRPVAQPSPAGGLACLRSTAFYDLHRGSLKGPCRRDGSQGAQAQILQCGERAQVGRLHWRPRHFINWVSAFQLEIMTVRQARGVLTGVLHKGFNGLFIAEGRPNMRNCDCESFI